MTRGEWAAANRDARRGALVVVLVLLIGLAMFAGLAALGQQSETTPVVPSGVHPATPLLDRITTPVVNFFGRHPIAFLVIGLAILVTNGLRVAWPTRADRPRLVAFLLGVLDPISGNFWALARWLADRVGFPVQSPKDDSPTGGGRLPDPNILPEGKK